MWQLQAFSFALFLGTTFSQCVYPPPATCILRKGLLAQGREWYAHQRFGNSVAEITDKCLRFSLHIWDFKPDISIHFPTVYFDERNNRQETTISSYVIGLKSKYYMPFNNTDYMFTDLVVTDSYFVSEVCDMNSERSEVLIFTPKKRRDEWTIKRATEEASKIMKLPSPSVNLECAKYRF
ncbi:unnamed protein product [Callosobruchus maculatus]|uniref:Lipocalin/cytosolic fatty-acid binding domain-containing protein n=1 Tax=Callosobruchus maculatus TaxID=64391 RepID=A0A653CAK9_CALMS|nr:unnamed protein product [Callosobruchus maculatus]